MRLQFLLFCLLRNISEMFRNIYIIVNIYMLCSLFYWNSVALLLPDKMKRERDRQCPYLSFSLYMCIYLFRSGLAVLRLSVSHSLFYYLLNATQGNRGKSLPIHLFFLTFKIAMKKEIVSLLWYCSLFFPHFLLLFPFFF